MDWVQYRENYPDLKRLLTTKQELETHWKMHGIREERTYTCIMPQPIKPVLVSMVPQDLSKVEAYIQHHLKIGFDTVYLYNSCNLPIPPHKDVVIISIPSIQYIGDAFYHFVHTYMQNSTHVAYTTEYIRVPSIQEFIKKHIKTDTNHVPTAGVQWKGAVIFNVKYYNSFTLS
jgi:hypothetical protein